MYYGDSFLVKIILNSYKVKKKWKPPQNVQNIELLL